MLYYRCKCGASETWGSMSPNQCAFCDSCGSNLSLTPHTHREPSPQEFVARPIVTDQGAGTISRCRFCGLTATEIEKRKTAS